MSKCVKIEYDGKTYSLTYTKRTIQEMEQNGFDPGKVQSMPATMIPLMFNGAFLANHRFTKEPVKNEIYRNLADKDGLFKVLGDIYDAALTALVEEPEDEEKKVAWTVE